MKKWPRRTLFASILAGLTITCWLFYLCPKNPGQYSIDLDGTKAFLEIKYYRRIFLTTTAGPEPQFFVIARDEYDEIIGYGPILLRAKDRTPFEIPWPNLCHYKYGCGPGEREYPSVMTLDFYTCDNVLKTTIIEPTSACPKGLKPGDLSPADHRVYFYNGYYGFQRDLEELKINGEPVKSLRFQQGNWLPYIKLVE